jgi:hypothetical protein
LNRPPGNVADRDASQTFLELGVDPANAGGHAGMMGHRVPQPQPSPNTNLHQGVPLAGPPSEIQWSGYASGYNGTSTHYQQHYPAPPPPPSNEGPFPMMPPHGPPPTSYHGQTYYAPHVYPAHHQPPMQSHPPPPSAVGHLNPATSVNMGWGKSATIASQPHHHAVALSQSGNMPPLIGTTVASSTMVRNSPPPSMQQLDVADPRQQFLGEGGDQLRMSAPRMGSDSGVSTGT